MQAPIPINLFESLTVGDKEDDDPFSHRRHRYKGKGEQKSRRDEFMLRQKEAKRDLTKHARNLASTPDVELVDAQPESSTKQSNRVRKDARDRFRDQLMIPEQLIDIPIDLVSEWYAVAVPGGTRCLVVASRNSTHAYLRNGAMINRFPSSLPGGSQSSGKGNEYSILDCIYHEPTMSFYVLDIMCWKNYNLYDCPTDFRFYWKMTKLQEYPELSTRNPKTNPFKFLSLPFHECTIESLSIVFSDPFTLDFHRSSVLLYNKSTHYSFGETPLVCVLQGDETEFIEAIKKGEGAALSMV